MGKVLPREQQPQAVSREAGAAGEADSRAAAHGKKWSFAWSLTSSF